MRIISLLGVVVLFLAIVFSVASIGAAPVPLMTAIGALLCGVGVLLDR